MSTEQAEAANIGQTTADVQQEPAGSIAYVVLQKLRGLPAEKQQEVLDFVEFLEQRSVPKPPRRNLKGLWAGLGIDITEEDIAEARREMWGNFPREDV